MIQININNQGGFNIYSNNKYIGYIIMANTRKIRFLESITLEELKEINRLLLDFPEIY